MQGSSCLLLFPEDAQDLKYCFDFIQTPEILSSIWHSAWCFFSAVPSDGASSGEGLSWKDVQLKHAPEVFIHWA